MNMNSYDIEYFCVYFRSDSVAHGCQTGLATDGGEAANGMKTSYEAIYY